MHATPTAVREDTALGITGNKAKAANQGSAVGILDLPLDIRAFCPVSTL